MADGNAKHGPRAQSKVPVHFTRHHGDCRKGDGDCDYTTRHLPYEAKDKTDPPAGWDKRSRYWNHHVLPVSSLRKFETWDAYSKQEAETICAVYAVTNWCSSRQSNLIRLPKNAGIRKKHDVRLPAHDCGHNDIGGYNEQVTTQLHLKVWTKAKKAKNKQIHSGTGSADILGTIQGLEGEFKKRLRTQGNKSGKAGDSMVKEILSREDLIAELKLKKGQKSWHK